MLNSSSTTCWHCSLLSYQVSYLSASTMHHFAGYLLPGLIFSLLGLRWAAQLVFEWTYKSVGGNDGSGSVRSLKGCRVAAFSLPWEGIIKLVLTGVGIVVSVSVSAGPPGVDEYVGSIRYATIYLFFALSGLMDILVYYCGYSVLPEGVQSFILSLAFAVEGLLFAMRMRFEGYLEQQVHALLVVVVFACSLACTMEVLYDNRLVKFCRAYLCIVQGTWLVHGGFIMQGSGTGESQTYPESLEWVSILFTWHVAGNFVLFVLALLFSCHLRKNGNRVCCCSVGAVGAAEEAVSASSSRSFHSPNTVQTNASPTSFQAATTIAGGSISQSYHSSNNGLSSFNYINNKQMLRTPPPLPPPGDTPHPLPSTSSAASGHTFNHVMYLQQQCHESDTRLLYQQQQEQQQQREQQQHEQHRQQLHQDQQRQQQQQQQHLETPVIVEAVPRDNLVMSDEYRTLTRQDELRASMIMLKESSLI